MSGSARVAFTHGFLCGDAVVLPRGKHRRTGGERNRQRPGDERRQAALCCPRRSSWKRDWRWRNCRGWSRRWRPRRHLPGVAIVTGDTKVVNRRSADKLFITTTGIGIVPEGVSISASNAQAGRCGDRERIHRRPRNGGDVNAGRYGTGRRDPVGHAAAAHSLVAAMLCRSGRAFTRCAIPLAADWARLSAKSAASSAIGVEIDARTVPVREDVKGACEILGIDPLFVANEGKLVAFVQPDSANAVLKAMRSDRRRPRRGGHRAGRIESSRNGGYARRKSAGRELSICPLMSSYPGFAD